MTNSSAVNSQAFGFMSAITGGVNHRTGQYTQTIDIPEFNSNQLCGPSIPLKLTFNPINTIIDSGWGLGWNLNLTQYTPHNSILSLSTGETYKVTGSGTHPTIKEKKLDSFHFEDNLDGTYRVIHKSGIIEILTTGGSDKDRVALPSRIYSPAGHSINLTYASFMGGQRLQSISDAQGELLQINRDSNRYFIEILVRPYGGPGGTPLARYEMKLNNSGWVTEIVLPTAEKASWRFGYGNGPIRGILCLHEVKTPVGGRETLEYADNGHPYPSGVSRPNLPRVTRHRADPGFGQPEMVVNYSYTTKNFLGAGATVNWEDGMDPTYNLSSDFEYGSTAELVNRTSRTVRKVDRTYNRFHLQTEEKTTQAHCVKRVTTTYYADNRPFDQQVPQFQLPKEKTTRWEMDNDGTKFRAEVERTSFDENGNPTEKIESSGIKTVYAYYPIEASDGCPADPHGFVRSLKETTVYPSPDGQGETPAPTLCTRLRHEALKPLANSDLQDWLVITDETLLQVDGTTETELQQTLRSYNQLPNDVFLHGRLLSQRQIINGKTTRTDYQYSQPDNTLAGGAVLQIDELLTGFDHKDGTYHAQISLKQVYSLITGQLVLKEDLTNVPMLLRYDALGRVTSETASPGDPQAQATRTYEYTLTSSDGQQSSMVVTDVKNAKTITHFDGLNRAVYQGRIEPDADSRAEPRQIYAAVHNEIGELIEETHFDLIGEKQLPITQAFKYDNWGMLSSTLGLDGVAIITDLSPFGEDGPIERNWQQSDEQPPQVSGLTISHYNRFGKVVSTQRLDAQRLNAHLRQTQSPDAQLSVKQHLDTLLLSKQLQALDTSYYTYDGLGNCIQLKQLTDEQERVTHYAYDAWKRVSSTTLPDKTIVNRRFADHSSSELTIDLQVTPGNANQPTVVVGQQSFDGLERLTEVRVGSLDNPRVEQYRYKERQMQVWRRVTPARKNIDHEYNLALSPQPVSITTLEGQENYAYDPLDAAISRVGTDDNGIQYKYSADGHLLSEKQVDNGKTIQDRQYVYSLLGRQMSSSVAGGLDTHMEYDDSGRLAKLTQGELEAEFTYNGLSLLSRTITRNLRTRLSLTTEVKYDTLTREIERTFQLTDQPLHTLTQTWFADDQLQSRHLQTAGRSLLKEEFTYDPRNRLIRHTCSGENLPTDVYGNAITQQVFTFDALDNIQRCVTTFKDDTTDIARFTYTGDDACQLSSVTHTHTAGGYPASQSFEYDADGNMLNDQHGKQLSYDSRGRLLAVKDVSGQQTLSTYRYDGHSNLLGVREDQQEETLRFYSGYRVHHTVQADKRTYYLHQADTPLGEQRLNDHDRTLLLMTDASPSVIGESLNGSVRWVSYSAYGARKLFNEEELQSLLAFNGEVCERSHGWYLLGRGYRAYNPGLMRFHSPDSLSPFAEGGINPYMYCRGNPINLSDPSGHAARGGRPELPVYVGGGGMSIEAWIGVGLAGIFLVGSAILMPWSAPMSVMYIVAIVGIVGQAAGVGLQVWGGMTNDSLLTTIGYGVGAVSGLVSGGAISSVRSTVKAAQLAAKEAAKAVTTTATVATATTDVASASVGVGTRASLTAAGGGGEGEPGGWR
ncbi:RHS repeat domain-containing protein [Pseudomonas fluorescens]